MKRLPVYILAGGRSSRFGSDKARAMFKGLPLLCHVAAMLEPVASHLTVVADRIDKYADLGFRTLADLQPGLGPLGGLRTALADRATDADPLLLCSCDALVIRSCWLNQLVEAMTEHHDAAAFRKDRWQPMPAIYSRRAAPVVARQIEQNQRSMQALLDQLRVAELPMPEDWPPRWQANTPADLSAFCPDSP